MSTENQNNKSGNPYLNHLLRYQQIYLCLLIIVIYALSLFANYLQQKPLLVGGESYYYLSLARQDARYNPLTLLLHIIPARFDPLLPLLISFGSMLLFYSIAQKIKLSETKTFFITLFFILAPAFILSLLSLSSYALYLFLVLLGINLILREGNTKYVAFLPLALACFFDTFTAMLLLWAVIWYFFSFQKSKESFPKIVVAVIAALLILNATVLNAPFLLGPFQVQNRAADLVSDLGGFSGVGIFCLLLALIGLVVSLQRKKIFITLVPLVIFVTAYIFNVQTIFFLALFVTILAAIGFIYIWEQPWKFSFLRSATILLLLLGMSFSAVAYLDRMAQHPPSQQDIAALQWIERNTNPEAVVLSSPDNSYYISYFAQRQPALTLHHNYAQQYNLSENVFTAYYINELFPLLEKNNVSIIYVSEDMKHRLPKQQEFLFLLQNERFKLLYFSGDTEVWSFVEAKK